MNYFNNYKLYSNKYYSDNNSNNLNKKSKLNKNKDNKDTKFKNKIYIINNNNIFNNINTNITIIKLNIIIYFINLLFSSKS